MANIINIGNGKLPTVADLENGAIKIENSAEAVDKKFIKKMIKTLNTIMNIAQRKERGIFNIILKWFRLYLKLGVLISPDDKKLLRHYEKCVPTVITYIIGCLQYKTKDVPNYHYNLLEILEELMGNVQSSVLKEINRFEKGTIGCLWNPIDLAGDFNTQMKALKILSVLLQQFDENRQNEELKYIKWTNLKFFQEKLKTIVQETKLSHVLENCSRELLNNYNMNLNKQVMVYSFYCKSVILGNIYRFHKPLNIQKFWIDINYCPKTLSYSGRFKLNSNSKYENISVILKIQKMILKNNTLQIYFNKPGDFSNHSDYLSKIADNVIEFTLGKEEKQRLISNNYIIEYFNSLADNNSTKCEKTDGKHKSTFDLLKNEMSKTLQENKNNKTNSGSNISKKSNNHRTTPAENMDLEKTPKFSESPQDRNLAETLVGSPKTSKNSESDKKQLPSRNLRNRKKFFTSLLVDDSDDEFVNKKTKKKRTQKAKSRQTKSRYKQVCKVTPTVDLTKVEKMECMEEIELHTNENGVKIPLNDNLSEKSFPLINTQFCDNILKQVADIYNTCDNTYVKPCQSYRNFQTQISPIQKTTRDSVKAKGRKKKNNLDNESIVEKKRKLTNCSSQENKENINPQNHITADKLRHLSKTRSTMSPHLFETQASEEIPSSNKLPETNNDKNKVLKNKLIDLTLDGSEQLPNCLEYNQDKECNILSSGSLEYEEVRGLNENYINDIDHICTPTKTLLSNSSKVTTPSPTSDMNVSNLDDSDMEITQVFNCQRRVEQESKIYDTNNTLQFDNDDMELTQPCYRNFFENDNPNIANLQRDCEVFKDDKESINIPQIVSDFNCGSNKELDSNYKTAAKGTSNDIIFNHLANNDLAHRIYNRECIIFQSRKDIEESSSSDEDSSYDEISDIPNFFLCNKPTIQNSAHMQNSPLFLNQNVCQKDDMWISPDKSSKISKSCTSGMAMRCQVTPTAIILHQYQISATKSVILASENSGKVSRANKCLNDYFTNIKTDNSAECQRKNLSLQNQHLNNFEESRPTCYTRTLAKRFSNKPDTLEAHAISENSAMPKPSNDYICGTFVKNPVRKLLCTRSGESLSHPQARSMNSILADEIENNYSSSNGLHQNTPLADLKSSFNKDLLNIIEDYNTNMKQRLDNAMRSVLKIISDKYTRKFLEITKTVLKKSEENRMELEKIRLNIGRLVRELEWQYDAFTNKSKEFDIHREVTERVMENIMNIDVSKCIAKDYDDIINQLNIEQNDVFQKVWQKYLDKLI